MQHESREDEMDDMGRYDIGNTTGSLTDALNDLQTAMGAKGSDASTSNDDARARWTVDVDVDDVEVQIDGLGVRMPETRPARGAAARSEARARRQAEPEIPSVIDRIAMMPRYRSTTTVSHPTGEAWIAPTQRQFCGRPPV